MVEDGISVLMFDYCIVNIFIILTICILYAFLKNTE